VMDKLKILEKSLGHVTQHWSQTHTVADNNNQH
jgi:hypothetical protein